jgi:hypothetical protein
MDRYTKAFVVASLAYLLAAATLGLWMGIGDAPEWAFFGHVHFNLLGFMAMMVYGVGYFILPRFNARPLRWPSWVPLHLITANLGLLGMVATSPERPSAGFTIFSLLSLLSVALFAVNLSVTLLAPAEEEKTAEQTAEEAAPSITPDTRMGEIITRWPQTVDVLVKNGFAPLADPAHQEKVKQLPVTLSMACANHQVDLDHMVGLLNEAASTAGPAAGKGGTIGHGDVIGEVLKAHPATEKVFRKYYGAACFSCPGQATETIRQSAMMHNADESELLRELNEAAGTA